jgi:hypothetical protein
LRTTNKSPGLQSMTIAGSTRESEQAITSVLGFCPVASSANS